MFFIVCDNVSVSMSNSVGDLDSSYDLILAYTLEPHLTEQCGRPRQFIQLNIDIYSTKSFM